MKTMLEIIAKLQNLEIRLITILLMSIGPSVVMKRMGLKAGLMHFAGCWIRPKRSIKQNNGEQLLCFNESRTASFKELAILERK